MRNLSDWRPLKVRSDEMLHLDALRIIASVAVVIYHFKAELYLSDAGKIFSSNLQGLQAAVDLFFFISGFVISRFYNGLNDRRSYIVFLWKRLARLYPLHVVTTFMFVLIGIASTAAHFKLSEPQQFEMACLPYNILLVHSLDPCNHLSFNQASWSISAEMILYLLFPIVIYLQRRRLLVLSGLSALILLMLLPPNRSGQYWYDWTYYFGMVRAIPSFILGAACFSNRKSIAKLPGGSVTMWILLTIALLMIILGLPVFLVIPTLYLTAIAGIAADIRKQESKMTRFLAAGGELTYSIYMIHSLVSLIFISFLGKKILGISGVLLNIWILIAIVITIAVSYVSYSFFEIPARKWMTSLYSLRAARNDPDADGHTPL